MKYYRLSLLISLLAVAANADPAQALTVCQESCNSQYYSTVNTLWQAPRPATITPTIYKQQVMTALNTLNQCMAACATNTTTPPVTTEPLPTPSPTPTKNRK